MKRIILTKVINPKTNAHYYVDGLGIMQGEYTRYDGVGEIRLVCNWLDGKLHGEYNEWFASGVIAERSFYVNGDRHGEHISYWPPGRVKMHCIFINGREVNLPATMSDKDKFIMNIKHGGLRWF